ncbi:hypothetical protein [Brachyspira pulli]|uniref:hypothetical protein n=1 Tax=Brachyspira pulli TaxID=310721 RepID=UPI0030068046
MEFNLILPYENEIEASDKTEIDRYIESTIELHKNNANKLTELTLEAASCLAAGEARAKQLSSQGFFKNLWGAITGKNRKIRGEIDYNFAVAQKASQRMIQVLAEQNKLTFEAVIAVNNKLNTMSVDINNQINEIYSVMKQMFQGLLGQIVQNSLKIEKLEQNVKLLNWNATIEYLTYDNRTYSSLDTFEKIICLSNDFYRMAGENRTTQDMLLLKTTMANCGIDINSKIKAIDFYRLLSSREDLIKRLFEDTKIENLEKALSYTIPISSGFRKLNLLAGEENYIVKSITSLSEASEEDIKVTLTKEYVKQHSHFDIEKEINIYEFAVMLINDLGGIDSFVDESEVISEKEAVPLLAESNTIETLFEDGKYYKVIEECNKIIEFNENNEEANKEDLINAYKYRAKCYINLNNTNTLDDIEKIHSINKNDIESYLIESDILIRDNELNKALEAIENGLEENNNNFELYKKKWEILFKLSNIDPLFEDIDQYIKNNKDMEFDSLHFKIKLADSYFYNANIKSYYGPSGKMKISYDDSYCVSRGVSNFLINYIAEIKQVINLKVINLNRKDADLYYLLAKYTYSLLKTDHTYRTHKGTNVLWDHDKYDFCIKCDYPNSAYLVEEYLKIYSGEPGNNTYTARALGIVLGGYEINVKYENYLMLMEYLDKALSIEPNYEEALLLKGVIYKMNKDTQNLLALKDEYVKQGLDPDKIFNKLFND